MSWTRRLEQGVPGGNPKHLQDGRPSYSIRIEHIVPQPVPNGVSQFWQVVDCTMFEIDMNCKLKITAFHIVDIVDIGPRRALGDTLEAIANKPRCLAWLHCVHTVGFGSRKVRFKETVNKSVHKRGAEKLKRHMTTPKGTFQQNDVYIAENCCKDLLEFLFFGFRPQAGEWLQVEGVGRFPRTSGGSGSGSGGSGGSGGGSGGSGNGSGEGSGSSGGSENNGQGSGQEGGSGEGSGDDGQAPDDGAGNDGGAEDTLLAVGDWAAPTGLTLPRAERLHKAISETAAEFGLAAWYRGSLSHRLGRGVDPLVSPGIWDIVIPIARSEEFEPGFDEADQLLFRIGVGGAGPARVGERLTVSLECEEIDVSLFDFLAGREIEKALVWAGLSGSAFARKLQDRLAG